MIRRIDGSPRVSLKLRARFSEDHRMRQGYVPPRRDQRGFTLVEVMVAASVLMIGVLGTFVMLDGASKKNRDNNARTAATSLAREVLEQAHRQTGPAATDDAALVERLGRTVTTVAGSEQAFKITRPFDLVVAEAVLAGR